MLDRLPLPKSTISNWAPWISTTGGPYDADAQGTLPVFRDPRFSFDGFRSNQRLDPRDVKDPSSAVIAGAKVTATMQETHTGHVAITTASGEYEFPVLAVGRYSLEIEASGFKTYLQKDVDVTIGQVVVIDAKLELGSPTQVVTVTGGAPLIETPGVIATAR